MRDPWLPSLALATALLLVGASSAEAHKLKAFAMAEGAMISGYAYFAPGGRARQATVTVSTTDGNVVATEPTDEDGNFRYRAEQRCDYRFTIDAGDGHVASYIVTAAELPDSLPGGILTTTAPAKADPPAAARQPADSLDLRAFIDQSVARQIRPLREQIDAYQEKIWWHDVLGGIGYILGLGGLAYGLSERRRREVPPSTRPERRPAR